MDTENYRGKNQIIKKEKKKHCFKDYKDNTIHSLNDVEYFLHSLNKAFKCANFYKLFK